MYGKSFRTTWLLCFLYLSTIFSLVPAVSVVGWLSPRTALIRDSVYIEGGGRYLGQIHPENHTGYDGYPASSAYGSLFKLNLTQPFNASNSSEVLEYIVPLQNDPNAAEFVDGALFANENGFFSYGGMSAYLRDDDLATGVILAELYTDSGTLNNASTIKSNVETSPTLEESPSTWVRCCGAGISVPSERLGFYFSGLVSANATNLMSSVSYTGQYGPSNLTNDLVTCNTTDLKQPRCSALDLPSYVRPRAESTMVWLPVGKHGSLAIIGGVEKPLDLFYGLYDIPFPAADPSFLTEIPIFDIAAKRWYLQTTTGSPPPMQAASCSVMASAADGSSLNVYVYGGYKDQYARTNVSYSTKAYDAVYVLSMPAFEWINVFNGTELGIQNHKCLQPYPDQMMVIGGVKRNSSYLLDSPWVKVFNLNTLQWSDTWDPTKWDDYLVPTNITDIVGGQGRGGATKKAANMDPELAALFADPYPSDVPYYWPYVTVSDAATIRRLGFERWMGATIGLLAYLLLCTFAFTFLVILRRRMAFKANDIHTPQVESKSRLVSWMHNATSEPLKGLNLNLGIKANKQQDEDYHPLREYPASIGMNDHDADITSAKSTATSRVYERSLIEDDGQIIEMRSFLAPGNVNTP